MNINDVIIRPIVTEKTAKTQTDSNVYTFEVSPKATKVEVRKAIETIFAKSDVKIKKVNIIKVRKKKKRMGRNEGYKKGYKKAMVFLSNGYIPIYGQEEEEKPKKVRKIIDTDKLLGDSK